MKLFSKSPFKLIFNVAMSMILLLFVGSSLASAQEGARVYLQPVDSTDGRLTVDIIAENVTNMYGAEVQLTYDPAVVSVQDSNPNQEGIQIEAGNLLPADKGFVVANRVNEAEGTIIFALTLLNPAPPANGTGPLARVTFNVLTPGPSTINIEKAKLVSIDLQTIPSQITPLAIGNGGEQNAVQSSAEQQSVPQEQPADATPPAVTNPTADTTNSSNFPWWIIAAGIMIVGVLGLGALVIMSGQNNSSQQTNKLKAQQQHQQPPQQSQALPQTTPQRVINQQRPKHVTGTRPSAFK